MTKREMFSAIAAVPAVAADKEMSEFLAHQIDLLDNRKSSGRKTPTAAQVANEKVKADILDALSQTDGGVTIKELLTDSRFESYTCQKMSALLRQLGETGTRQVVKEKDKKTTLFRIAKEGDYEVI